MLSRLPRSNRENVTRVNGARVASEPVLNERNQIWAGGRRLSNNKSDQGWLGLANAEESAEQWYTRRWLFTHSFTHSFSFQLMGSSLSCLSQSEKILSLQDLTRSIVDYPLFPSLFFLCLIGARFSRSNTSKVSFRGWRIGWNASQKHQKENG